MGLWSFAVALAHGAALMLVPIYLGLCRQADLDRGHEAAGTLINANLGMAVLVAIVHAAAMIAAGGCCAWLAYRYLGLKFISQSWFNLDTIWAVSLILVGAIALVLEPELTRKPWTSVQRNLPSSSIRVSRSFRIERRQRLLRYRRARSARPSRPVAGRRASGLTSKRRPSSGSGLVSVRPRAVRRSITPLMVATSIAVSRPSRFCEHGPVSASLRDGRPLRRRQVDADFAGEDGGVALPDLAQDEADLLIEDVGRPCRLDRSFRRNTPCHLRPLPFPYSDRCASRMSGRASSSRHRAAETDLAAFDDVGAVRNQPREMQVLLRDHDADAFPLHREDGLDHLFDDLRRQPFRGLVEQHQRRIAHQRPRDSQHLLFAAAHPPAGRFRISPRLGNSVNSFSRVHCGAFGRFGWRPTSRFSSTVRSVKMRRSSGT